MLKIDVSFLVLQIFWQFVLGNSLLDVVNCHFHLQIWIDRAHLVQDVHAVIVIILIFIFVSQRFFFYFVSQSSPGALASLF